MHHAHDIVEDLSAFMTLVSVSCEFNANTQCEAKFEIDGVGGQEGELRLRIATSEAEKLKIGDVYSIRIRRL